MGTADISILIQEIQVLSTLKGHFHTVMLRLSASANAAARACHDFYKFVMLFTTFNGF